MSPGFGHSQKTHWEVLIYFCGKSGAKEAENTAACLCIEQWELLTRCRHQYKQVLWFAHFLFQLAFIVWAKVVYLLWSAFFWHSTSMCFCLKCSCLFSQQRKKYYFYINLTHICRKQLVSNSEYFQVKCAVTKKYLWFTEKILWLYYDRQVKYATKYLSVGAVRFDEFLDVSKWMWVILTIFFLFIWFFACGNKINTSHFNCSFLQRKNFAYFWW